MTLSEILLLKKNNTIKNAPADKVAIMLEATEALKKEHISQSALKKGDTLPSFTLPNVKNKNIRLEDFNDDFLVISFYRGGWCPYCNLELKALQTILPELENLKTRLIAITPETPDNSLTTSEKNELAFEVLSDLDNQYAKRLGLVFKMPDALVRVYKDFGLHVDQHNGNEEFELPMPATFIINKHREVIYRFVSEDYTERAEPSYLLDVIKQQS